MPKIIVTSRYLKNGIKKKLSNYVKYIATREGVVNNRENYIGYLANRPGAVKFGAHGLFSQEDKPIDLNAAAKEVANHKGNVWTHVVSLKREDAQRMGYDTLTAWRELVKRQIPNIAKQSKIDLSNLRWYAAFHDKETNPHVHIVVYSVNPKEGFLTKHGIEKIRSSFANDIYQDELHHLYAQQTDVRNQLKKLSTDLMRKLTGQIAANCSPDMELVQLIAKLHQQLSNAKGKKVYGYLKPDVKKTVDEVFARLAQNADIQQMYKLWCNMEKTKHDVYSSAKVQFPDLTNNPQFKSVKNIIVNTVASMQIAPPDFTPLEIENEDVPMEIPPDGFDFEIEFTAEGVTYKIEWSDAYKQACKLFYKKNKTDAEKYKCLRLFQAEADAGNVLALHDLGKLYGSAFLGEPDEELSAEYYRQALTGFLELEDFVERMKPYLQYCIGKMFACGIGTEQDEAAAFSWFQKSALAGNKYAQHSLASCFYYGRGTEQDLSEAFRWYMAAAKKGMPYSAYALAQMYERGVPISQDDDKAQQYYRTALSGFLKIMDDGNADDQLLYKLGRMFLRGLGTDIDIPRAADLFQQAAKHRNHWAEYQLGKLYLFGTDGITPDREQAVDLLTRSAEDGNEYAEQMLRRMVDYQNRVLTDAVFGLFMNVGRIIEDDYDRTGRVIHSRVDSKLRCAIRKKKQEIGIKDDHAPMQNY